MTLASSICFVFDYAAWCVCLFESERKTKKTVKFVDFLRLMLSIKNRQFFAAAAAVPFCRHKFNIVVHFSLCLFFPQFSYRDRRSAAELVCRAYVFFVVDRLALMLALQQQIHFYYRR